MTLPEPPRPIVLLLESPERTEVLGASVAALAYPGLRILLTGPLGAGKSVFARGFLRELGVSRVRSPSFGLIHELPTVPPVAHCDLYRLDSESVEELGVDEYSDSGWILLVEWADRRVDWGAEDILRVDLAYAPEEMDVPSDDGDNDREPPTIRSVGLSARGRRALDLLLTLTRAWPGAGNTGEGGIS